MIRRGAWVAGFLAVVALVSAVVYGYGRGEALRQLARRGSSDLALAADRLTGQLRRYQEMAVLLAPHPDLPGPGAEALLLAASDKTAALNLFYVDRTGRILARANASEPAEVATGAWIERAMQGALGAGHGLYGAEGRRAYYYAAPRFGVDGRVAGALVVVVDLARLEEDWPGTRPAVFFTDAGGTVFVANRPELLFWREEGAGLRPPGGGASQVAVRDEGGLELWRGDLGPYVPARALHLVRDLPVLGMRAEALVDTGPARRLAGLQAAVIAAVMLLFGALLFLTTERRRALATANRTLEARVAARTEELTSANRALRREVQEREEAEAALTRAQAELVQAGKLSALGQMSAGISHELNQPLMAIGQFAENGAAFLDRGRAEAARENLGRIAALSARAARIIRNLRAFARNEAEPVARVDLGQVIAQAVEMSEERLAREGIALDWARPARPVAVTGGEVRLTQVFLNLITNAADAMAGQAGAKRIEIAVERAAERAAERAEGRAGRIRVHVRDTGPGIDDPERIFEPFYSTKAVGSGEEGMGLGLSISYGLVQSFGGDIRGANRAGGGADFTVELDPWDEAGEGG